jgi:hypothetical protein
VARRHSRTHKGIQAHTDSTGEGRGTWAGRTPASWMAERTSISDAGSISTSTWRSTQAAPAFAWLPPPPPPLPSFPFSSERQGYAATTVSSAHTPLPVSASVYLVRLTDCLYACVCVCVCVRLASVQLPVCLCACESMACSCACVCMCVCASGATDRGWQDPSGRQSSQ